MSLPVHKMPYCRYSSWHLPLSFEASCISLFFFSAVSLLIRLAKRFSSYGCASRSPRYTVSLSPRPSSGRSFLPPVQFSRGRPHQKPPPSCFGYKSKNFTTCTEYCLELRIYPERKFNLLSFFSKSFFACFLYLPCSVDWEFPKTPADKFEVEAGIFRSVRRTELITE